MKFSSYITENTLIVGYKEQYVRILVYCKHHMKIFGRLQETQFHFNVCVTCSYHRVLWVK
jgi:hypothetical protein